MTKKQQLYDSQFEDLADIALSGNYSDLINKPTLGTAAAANVEDFASATQGALADTAVQPNQIQNNANRIAIFDGDGDLQTNNNLLVNEYSGFSFFKNEGGKADNPDPLYRSLNAYTFGIESMITDVYNETTTLLRLDLQHDLNNSAFDYTGGGGELNNLAIYFRHAGNGFVNRVQGINSFLEFGDSNQGIAGSADSVFGINNNLIFRNNFSTSNFSSILNNNAEVWDFCSINSLNLGTFNLNLKSNGSITQYFTGISLSVDANDNSTLPDSSLISSNMYIKPGVNTGDTLGLNVALSNLGTMNRFTGVNVNLQGSGAFTNMAVGAKINMGTYDASLSRRSTFQGEGGIFANINQITTASNMALDQGNLVVNQFQVKPGEPITGTSFLSNNFSTLILAEDDIDAGVGLGIVGVGFVGQVYATENSTISLINFSLGGCSITDNPGQAGIVDKANIYNAMGVIPFGNVNPITMTFNEVRGFTMPNLSMGTDIWGVDIEHPLAENHFAKSIVIGLNNNKVSDSNIGLEIADKKVMKLTPMTIADRDSITATEGMIVSISDGAIHELQYYTDAAWVTL